MVDRSAVERWRAKASPSDQADLISDNLALASSPDAAEAC
jgi:hypothetical protein